MRWKFPSGVGEKMWECLRLVSTRQPIPAGVRWAAPWDELNVSYRSSTRPFPLLTSLLLLLLSSSCSSPLSPPPPACIRKLAESVLSQPYGHVSTGVDLGTPQTQ